MNALRRIAVVLAAVGVAIAPSLGLAAPDAGAGGACRGTPATDGTGTTVEMANGCFVPTVLHIEPGDTVTWTNRDAVSHMVSGANISWGDYSELAMGGQASHRFDEPGAYSYYCFAHPGMVGAIVVGDGSEQGAAGSSVVALGPGPDQPVGTAADSTASDGASPGLVIGIAAALAVLVASATGAIGFAVGRRVQ